MAQAAAAAPGRNTFTLADLITAPFRPFGSLLKVFIAIIVIAAIVLLLVVVARVGFNWWKLGSGEVAVAHVSVAAETPKGFLASALYKISPDLGNLWEGKTYVDTFSSEVVANEQNPNLGVKIRDFESAAEFFRENSEIKLSGSILASSLADQVEIAAFCSLEDYRKGQPIQAQLFGTTIASANTGIVYKNQEAEFQARCIFPQGLKTEKPREAKIAKLIILYEFTTKATQKLWFLDKSSLLALEGRDPFAYYSIDGQLDSRGRSRSKSTAGPINFGINVDLPQPLTDETPYILTVQLSNNIGWLGNLEKLESLRLQLPAARDLEILMEGEGRFAVPDSKCDFEYTGPGEDQFKAYELKPEYLADVNKDCNEDTLRSLALTRKDCIDFFKSRPTFTCLFKAIRVPEGALQYDSIRAEATYIYRVEKDAVVEIRKTPVVA